MQLEQRLFPPPIAPAGSRPLPDFSKLHQELKSNRSVTLQLLWEEYARLQETQKHFAMRKVTQASQIYPVFRDLFKTEGAAK